MLVNFFFHFGAIKACSPGQPSQLFKHLKKMDQLLNQTIIDDGIKLLGQMDITAQLASKIAFLGGKIAAILPPSIPRQSIHPAPSWAPGKPLIVAPNFTSGTLSAQDLQKYKRYRVSQKKLWIVNYSPPEILSNSIAPQDPFCSLL